MAETATTATFSFRSHPAPSRASDEDKENSSAFSMEAGEDSAVKMRRWLEATSGAGGGTPLGQLQGTPGSTTGKLAADDPDERFAQWLSATSAAKFTPPKSRGPPKSPGGADEPDEQAPRDAGPTRSSRAAAPAAASTPVLGRVHAGAGQCAAPAGMRPGQGSSRGTPGVLVPVGTPGGGAGAMSLTPLTAASGASTAMSVAYSEISAAVSRMTLRTQLAAGAFEFPAGATAEATDSPSPVLLRGRRASSSASGSPGEGDNGGYGEMDVSPALLMLGLGLGAGPTAVQAGGILAMTGLRPGGPGGRGGVVVPASAARARHAAATPQRSPVDEVLDLMVTPVAAEAAAPGDDDDAVLPQQLRFDDEAGACGADGSGEGGEDDGDESGDEVSLGELAMMTPVGTPGGDALWRAVSARSTTPLSDLLAMMATPGGDGARGLSSDDDGLQL
ncbi:hypothetical protein FOA52_009338 [Chlamydomonas sp. UWO 241]|nr:hypothetical protein FOA52_009338 [Chlamydomonas sp. UWO 241]